jgi:hypothetical protein
LVSIINIYISTSSRVCNLDEHYFLVSSSPYSSYLLSLLSFDSFYVSPNSVLHVNDSQPCTRLWDVVNILPWLSCRKKYYWLCLSLTFVWLLERKEERSWRFFPVFDSVDDWLDWFLQTFMAVYYECILISSGLRFLSLRGSLSLFQFLFISSVFFLSVPQLQVNTSERVRSQDRECILSQFRVLFLSFTRSYLTLSTFSTLTFTLYQSEWE